MSRYFINQVSKEEIPDLGYPISLCIFNLYPLDFTKRFGINFTTFLEDGLGEVCTAIIEIADTYYVLVASVDDTGKIGLIADDPNSSFPEREAVKVTVKVSDKESDIDLALGKLLSSLELTKEDIYWSRADGRENNC